MDNKRAQKLPRAPTLVLILKGNCDKCALRNLCFLICLRHLIRSRAVNIGFFSPKRPIFPHAYATCSELPSNIPSKY